LKFTAALNCDKPSIYKYYIIFFVFFHFIVIIPLIFLVFLTEIPTFDVIHRQMTERLIDINFLRIRKEAAVVYIGQKLQSENRSSDGDLNRAPSTLQSISAACFLQTLAY
jgi:hypothetical protein